jgi:hypothetical protein
MMMSMQQKCESDDHRAARQELFSKRRIKHDWVAVVKKEFAQNIIIQSYWASNTLHIMTSPFSKRARSSVSVSAHPATASRSTVDRCNKEVGKLAAGEGNATRVPCFFATFWQCQMAAFNRVWSAVASHWCSNNIISLQNRQLWWMITDASAAQRMTRILVYIRLSTRHSILAYTYFYLCSTRSTHFLRYYCVSPCSILANHEVASHPTGCIISVLYNLSNSNSIIHCRSADKNK